MAEPMAARILAGVMILLAAACTPVSDKQADRAEDACLDEARHEGFRKIGITSSAVGVGDIVILSMEAERNGNPFSGSCSYDRKNRRAEINLTRSEAGDDALIARARETCREEAGYRDFNVQDIRDVQVRDHSIVRMTMSLRRSGNDFRGVCRYERGHADLDVERR